MNWTPVCYEYDGSFAGFLTCVFRSYAHREEPVCFAGPEDGRYTLWDTRRVEADGEQARRVWRGLCLRVSPGAAELVGRGFLTCLAQRELCLWRFIRYAFERGAPVMADLGDERVDTLRKAVRHLDHEAHLYTGFVRFSDQRGVLVGEIEPKNRVLPVLRPHFTGRFNTEQFILYDRTHAEALVYRPRQWAIIPMDSFTPGAPGVEELSYRRLWRRFFETVAIRERAEPRRQNAQLAKRFRPMMTEFWPDEASLPER